MWRALLWLLLIGLVCPPVMAQIAPTAPLPEIRVFPQELTTRREPQLESLFYREPWEFGPETFTATAADLERGLTTLEAGWLRLRSGTLTLNDYLLLAGLLLVALMLGSLRLSDHYFQRQLTRLAGLLPSHWPLAVRHLTRLLTAVLSRSLIFLTVLFLTYLVWGAFSPDSRLFPILIELLRLAVVYRSLHLLCQELFDPPDSGLFNAEKRLPARALYRRLHRVLLGGTLFLGSIAILKQLHYRADLINFLSFLLSGGLLLTGAGMATHKQQIFSLLPELDEPLWLRFREFLTRFYSGVMVFTFALGVLWVMGYHHLAHLLFLHSWVLVGVLLGRALLHRWLLTRLQNWPGIQREGPLARTLVQALWLSELLLTGWLLLSLLGIRAALFDWLGQPIASIGSRPLSCLSLAGGLLTAFVFSLSARLLNAWLEERVFPDWEADTGLQQMITLSILYLSNTLGLLMGLSVTGLDLSVFTIFAGALAFGAGFGLQGLARNFASGLVLIFTGLVKKGDYITVGEYTGYIQQVSWKHVHLRTPDHLDLIVPTVQLVEAPIVNWTYSGREVRVHLPVSVAYDSDPNQVRATLLRVAAEHPLVLSEPPPQVWLKEFGDSALNCELLVWIDNLRTTFEALRGDINFAIWAAFRQEGIEIPFPQRDLHIRSGTLETRNPPAQD